MITAANNANFAKGVAQAEYQTAGLLAADADTVRVWRRQAMDKKSKVRIQAKKDALAGFIRGLSDWLANNA